MLFVLSHLFKPDLTVAACPCSILKYTLAACQALGVDDFFFSVLGFNVVNIYNVKCTTGFIMMVGQVLFEYTAH